MPIHVCGHQSQESTVVGLAWVKGHLCGCGASWAVSASPAGATQSGKGAAPLGEERAGQATPTDGLMAPRCKAIVNPKGPALDTLK